MLWQNKIKTEINKKIKDKKAKKISRLIPCHACRA
jgi:hypothetical protein